MNAYAVLRELVSLNTGKLHRDEILDLGESAADDRRGAPYGRVFLFDDNPGNDEFIPMTFESMGSKVADALCEYLYGPGHGKITSALDNTLAEVYATGGENIYGAFGRTALVFPRSLYHQYCLCRLIDTTLSNNWLAPDENAIKRYREELKKTRENGEKNPGEDLFYRFYNEYIDFPEENTTTFRAAISRQVKPCPYYIGAKALPFEEIEGVKFSGAKKLSVGDWFFTRLCDDFVENHVTKDKTIQNIIDCQILTDSDFMRGSFMRRYSMRREAEPYICGFGILYDKYTEKVNLIPLFVESAMYPYEVQKDAFFDPKEEGNCIYYYIRDKRFHPVAIRYFLYDLYRVLNTAVSQKHPVSDLQHELDNAQWDEIFKGSKTNRNLRLKDLANTMYSSAVEYYRGCIAEALLPEVKEMIHEIEDLFRDILKVKEFFSDSADVSLNTFKALDDEPDKVVAGSALSAHNCWKRLECEIHNGEEGDDEVIDDKMSAELRRFVYTSYLKHTRCDRAMAIKGSEQSLRFRTQYSGMLRSSLQRHISSQLSNKYSAIFPANVVEAVIEDCRVKNCWNVLENENPDLRLENFICTNVVNNEYAGLARQAGLMPLDPAQELNKLLARALDKSVPRCGLVDQAADDDFSIRYMILAEDLLPVISDIDPYTGDAVVVRDRSCILPGVPTSTISGINVNPCFEGNSPDEIVLFSVQSGGAADVICGLRSFDIEREESACRS